MLSFQALIDVECLHKCFYQHRFGLRILISDFIKYEKLFISVLIF